MWRMLLFSWLFLPFVLSAQKDSLDSKLSFTGDFRFRIEQDWNSRKSDASYRDDRTRLRYRFRFGANYEYNEWINFGLRIRTGDPQKQQDPQLTLGEGFKEFGTLPIGFEKIFFEASQFGFLIWLGKNTFPFAKQNELFWSDNVFPEGVFVSKQFDLSSKLLESIKLSAGHFIIEANGSSMGQDSYFQGFQIQSAHWDDRFRLFPSLYLFKNVADIPDGKGTYFLDYSIFHIGSKFEILENPKVTFELDYYVNFENLHSNDSIPQKMMNEKNGMVAGLSLGHLQSKNDWMFKLTYTYLERYAAVDFLAQNDWARWDYSSQGSPDGRLTNFKGWEIFAGYAINKKLTLKMRYFKVDQIVPYGVAKETGDRIRFDLDIGF